MGTDRQPCLFDGFALTFNIASLVRVKRTQVIVKGFVVLVLPNKAVVQPTKKAVTFHGDAPLWVGVQKITARNLVADAKLVDRAYHQLG